MDQVKNKFLLSIILAGIIGLVPLILSDKITGAISNTALRILNVTLFNPIEVITMTTLNGTSKLSTSKLGLPRTMTLTSDKEKHAQVLKLIFEKAQLNEKMKMILVLNRGIFRTKN